MRTEVKENSQSNYFQTVFEKFLSDNIEKYPGTSLSCFATEMKIRRDIAFSLSWVHFDGVKWIETINRAITRLVNEKDKEDIKRFSEMINLITKIIYYHDNINNMHGDYKYLFEQADKQLE
ncbi:MAG: hypothetical protein LBP67_00195 [Bacteroidales bacterium]|jgi:hypothetical protein|nr:hypothetical protein [Bacteroidales bacterium]